MLKTRMPPVLPVAVAVDVGADRVLDLDAGDVRLGAVVAYDHVLRLADVDAGIGSADRKESSISTFEHLTG